MVGDAGRPARVIGVMSGSSLDGLDLALCSFERSDDGWHGRIEQARTVPFPPALLARLRGAMDATALEAARLHRDLGDHIGEACRSLAAGGPVDLVCSHGHTLFHRPEEGLTAALGCGARIAVRSGMATVCDLRTTDVALGGQGAPLVPLAERLLFPGQEAFLNLGGIANLAVHRAGTTGYDIGPCNQALDHLARQAGKPYDADGALAGEGTVKDDLLAALEALPFYRQPPPRSLGREWFEAEMRPLIDEPGIPLRDRLRTVSEHVARRIAAELDRHAVRRVLITGGGAHNTHLLERVGDQCKAELRVPEALLVDFKEAYLFALLGLLRWRGEVNALASVTGAARDSAGGAVYLP
ncbi:MAG: anhydro-N-acetylmuramic acid kinase [Flavobacteriales bacterium]|nr:anhydro-N-acetylmuramic acid kinase [Flavobacteriales bacterium]